jgi:hypothetical protein
LLENIPLPENVFAPAIVCAPVVTNPLAVALASGIANVCAVPLEVIAKSVPVVATANVCVAPVSPLRLLIPLPPPPLAASVPPVNVNPVPIVTLLHVLAAER